MKMNKIFALSAISLALTGCGTDSPDVSNAPGTLTLSGNAVAGETLTATVSDPDGVSGTVSYQWLVNNTPLTSATSSTFTLTADQRGAVMRVSATYIDDNGTRESMTSNETGAVLANVDGVVTVSGSEIVDETLTAALVDDNGVSGSVTFSWAADGIAIDGANEATFVLTPAQEGTVVTATATYIDDEGFAETAVSAATVAIAPAGTNTPATFDGLTASVTNAATAAITGTIVVTDIDDGEATIVAQTDTTTTYGSFSVTDAGAFTYTLNVADAAVAALMGASDTLADQVSITSFDGTIATFDITISGVNAPAAGNQAAVIRDLTDDDTGELRFSLPEALAQGRLEVTFTRTDDAVGSTDAFISLFNSGNNNAGNILDLRVKDDSYAIRSPSSIDVSAATVVPGTLSTVVATWEYPNGNTATGSFPVINLTIDDVVIPEYTVADSTPEGGVTTVSFRLGSNSGVYDPAAQYTINEFAVYSDTAGTALVFEDDFSGYAVDFALDGELSDTSPYADNTEDATVEAFDDGSVVGGPGESGNKYAQILDTLDSDTGELRYVLPEAQAAGKVTFAFARTDDNVGSADAFFSLFNSGNNNAGNILDLRIRDDSYQTRSPSQDFDTALAAVTPGQYHNVEVTWAYPNGNVTAGSLPVVNITIDGTALPEYTVSGSDPIGGVTTVSFRLGGNSATTPVDAQFWVDNIKVYSDVAGTTLVFEDDFEAYDVDFDLDNGTNTPYNERTSEATVKAEQ